MATNYEEYADTDYIRPAWPYRSWKFSEITHGTEESDTTNETTDDDVKTDLIDEADHDADSDDDISDSSSINILFDYINSPSVAETDEAKQINSMISVMIDKTLNTLSSSFKVFKDSYMIPIGSMTENSKIYKPDEFDFAIVLPSLADEDVFALLLREDSIQSNKNISDLLDDTSCNSTYDFIMNFSTGLRQLWAKEMRRNAADDWEILDTTCCLDDVSVAGTFHIKRLKENDIVDLDICVWIPLTAEKLSSAPAGVTQRHYLRKHCLDQYGLVYAILPRDEGIDFAINSVRFPMSSLEKQSFQEYGQDKNRIKCYRLCKCIVHHLVPKYRKRDTCNMCFECIISSFALKNTVLYLMAAYKTDNMWAGGQLINRVIEVFSILCMCMKVNFSSISTFFSPYEIKLNSSCCFNPETCCIETQPCYIEIQPCEFYGQDKKPCTIPTIEGIITKIEDPISKRALSEYDEFLRQSCWRSREVVCRLYELLCVLREEDPVTREQLVKDVGWSQYGLEISSYD